MRCCLIIVLLALCVHTSAQAQEAGLFANLVTSKGTIRARLEYEKVPATVANFIGLIEGTQTALNLEDGSLINGRFYDGMIFHKVIANAMIQTGSPNGDGDGDDGPGYVFQDEFDPQLTHEAFVLSMANTGPNSNGSQFFITVAEAPQLNNKHSVFGRVLEGSDVVTLISKVSTDQGDKPLQPVTLETITIQRVGAAAKAFVSSAAELPLVRHLPVHWQRSEGRFRLDTSFQRNSDVRLFLSPNLRSWDSERIAFLGDDELPELPVDVSKSVVSRKTGFFRIAEIKYPTVVFPPRFLLGKTLDTTITKFGQASTTSAISYQFNTPTSGTAKLGSNSAVRLNTFLYRIDSPTRATLIAPSDLITPLNLPQFSLNFTSATTGNFIAVLPNAFPVPTTMEGTFLLNVTP